MQRDGDENWGRAGSCPGRMLPCGERDLHTNALGSSLPFVLMF